MSNDLKALFDAAEAAPELAPREWVLHCRSCGFQHEKMTAARPFCDECGSRLTLTVNDSHLPKLLRHDFQPGRMTCTNQEYLDALDVICRTRLTDLLSR
jgi:hypothetical protein